MSAEDWEDYDTDPGCECGEQVVWQTPETDALCQWCPHPLSDHEYYDDDDAYWCKRHGWHRCPYEAPDWAEVAAGEIAEWDARRWLAARQWNWLFNRLLDVMSGERDRVCWKHAVLEPCPSCAP